MSDWDQELKERVDRKIAADQQTAEEQARAEVQQEAEKARQEAESRRKKEEEFRKNFTCSACGRREEPRWGWKHHDTRHVVDSIGEVGSEWDEEVLITPKGWQGCHVCGKRFCPECQELFSWWCANCQTYIAPKRFPFWKHTCPQCEQPLTFIKLISLTRCKSCGKVCCHQCIYQGYCRECAEKLP